MDGLTTILRQKYDPKYAEEQEFEKQKKLSGAMAKAIKDVKDPDKKKKLAATLLQSKK